MIGSVTHPKFHLLKRKQHIRKKWEKVCCSCVFYAFFQLSENVKSFFSAIFLGNRASAGSVWCSVTLDVMADFFQRRWRFQKKARSCRVWEMKCLGKGDQVRVSHGHLNTKTPEHPQGTDQRDAWALVKPCWELATALGPSTQAEVVFVQWLSQFIPLVFKLALLYTISVTGIDLWFLYMQETYSYLCKIRLFCLSLPARQWQIPKRKCCLEATLATSSLRAQTAFSKSRSLALHVIFPQPWWR